MFLPPLIANGLYKSPLNSLNLWKTANRQRIAWRRVPILQDVPSVSRSQLIHCKSADKSEGCCNLVNQLHFLLCPPLTETQLLSWSSHPPSAEDSCRGIYHHWPCRSCSQQHNMRGRHGGWAGAWRKAERGSQCFGCK